MDLPLLNSATSRVWGRATDECPHGIRNIIESGIDIRAPQDFNHRELRSFAADRVVRHHIFHYRYLICGPRLQVCDNIHSEMPCHVEGSHHSPVGHAEFSFGGDKLEMMSAEGSISPVLKKLVFEHIHISLHGYDATTLSIFDVGLPRIRISLGP